MAALDTQEMLHMAIHASASQRPDDAIRTLKDLIAAEADNGDAHFLIAANYAEIALLEKSITHYKRAIELQPEQDYARMQFALLLTAMDRLDEAAAVLSPFLEAERDDAYTLFAKGLQELFAERLSEARDLFSAGIAANQTNEALNNDIGRLLTEIDTMQGTAPTEKTVAASSDSSSAYLLSTYNKRH